MTATGRVEPKSPSSWSPETGRPAELDQENSEDISTGRSWPSSVDAWVKLLAGNLTFNVAPELDFGRHLERLVLAGSRPRETIPQWRQSATLPTFNPEKRASSIQRPLQGDITGSVAGLEKNRERLLMAESTL